MPPGRALAQVKERYANKRPYGSWLADHAVTMQTLVATVPPDARVPQPLPGVRAPSSLLAASSAATNGNGNGNGAHKAAASNIVTFTPTSASPSGLTGPAAATAEDAGLQSLITPLKVFG